MNDTHKITAGENPKSDVRVMSKLLKNGFTIILILILLLAALNIFQLQKTKQQLGDLVSKNIKKMALGSIVLDSIRERSIILYKMLDTDDYFVRDELLSNLYKSARRFREARTKSIALGESEIEKKINNKVLALVREVQPISRGAGESMLSDLPHSELRVKVKNAIVGQDKIFAILTKLNTFHENQSKQALEDVNKNFTYTVVFTLLVAGIVIYLSIRVALKIYRHVINTSNILAYKNIDLENAYAKAEESTKIKSEFLDKMSHELRTPMNGIMGALQLLKTTPLSEEQEDYTEMAMGSSNSLLSMINDILDFSKIESGKMHVNKSLFSPASIINDVIHSFEKTAHQKNIKLHSSIDSNINKQYLGDSDKITQILMHLVDNAIKFTKDGDVNINVSIEENEKTSKLFYFEVRDTGIGVTDKDSLFTVFNQADNSIGRNYDGAGIGLSICKKLVSLMDGEIGVQDAEDEGSIFWFTLRLEGLEA